mgnify:FL=1
MSETERPMTAEEAQGYIELAEAATAGEWDSEWSSAPSSGDGDVGWIYRRDDPSGPTVAEAYTEADGKLIAVARVALPRLARAWLAEHKQVAEARAEVVEAVLESKPDAS